MHQILRELLKLTRSPIFKQEIDYQLPQGLKSIRVFQL